LAASNWADMFQDKTKLLQAKLDMAYKENERLTEITKAFHIKKNVEASERLLTTQTMWLNSATF